MILHILYEVYLTFIPFIIYIIDAYILHHTYHLHMYSHHIPIHIHMHFITCIVYMHVHALASLPNHRCASSSHTCSLESWFDLDSFQIFSYDRESSWKKSSFLEGIRGSHEGSGILGKLNGDSFCYCFWVTPTCTQGSCLYTEKSSLADLGVRRGHHMGCCWGLNLGQPPAM